MEMLIERLRATPVEELPIEVVERKGLGHPDYICDAIAEEISIALSQEYLNRFGEIMHHNIDKMLLAAGEAEQRFGGGVIKKPMLLVFGDRATSRVGNEVVDVANIAITAAKAWLRKNLRFVSVDEHVRYQVEIKPVSIALADLFKRGKGKSMPANDTSAAVGYAPLSKTERLVLEIERFLNSKRFKRSFPFTGEDVKVMAIRRESKIKLIVAMSFIDRFIESEKDYFKKKSEVVEELD